MARDMGPMVKQAIARLRQKYGVSLLREDGTEMTVLRVEAGHPGEYGLKTPGDGCDLRDYLGRRGIRTVSESASHGSTTLVVSDAVEWPLRASLSEGYYEDLSDEDKKIYDAYEPVVLNYDVWLMQDPALTQVVAAKGVGMGAFRLWVQQQGLHPDRIGKSFGRPMMVLKTQEWKVTMDRPPGVWISAGGCVIVDVDEKPVRIWVIAPKGQYGGYKWTMPKGGVDFWRNEDLKRAAVREVREETGLRSIVLRGSYLGSFKTAHSVTTYFMMVTLGGTPTKNSEVSQIKAVTLDEAAVLFKGSARDTAVIKKARKWVDSHLDECLKGLGGIQIAEAKVLDMQAASKLRDAKIQKQRKAASKKRRDGAYDSELKHLLRTKGSAKITALLAKLEKGLERAVAKGYTMSKAMDPNAGWDPGSVQHHEYRRTIRLYKDALKKAPAYEAAEAARLAKVSKSSDPSMEQFKRLKKGAKIKVGKVTFTVVKLIQNPGPSWAAEIHAKPSRGAESMIWVPKLTGRPFRLMRGMNPKLTNWAADEVSILK